MRHTADVSRTLRLDDSTVTGVDDSADLERLLPEGTGAPASIPAPVFDAALRRVNELHRLDMRALAAELGVGRATLYRWVGSRDALLGEVFWWRARHSHARSLRASAGLTGRDRVLTAFSGFLAAAQRAPSLHRFLAAEPEVAMRVLTSRAARVQAGSLT